MRYCCKVHLFVFTRFYVICFIDVNRRKIIEVIKFFRLSVCKYMNGFSDKTLLYNAKL